MGAYHPLFSCWDRRGAFDDMLNLVILEQKEWEEDIREPALESSEAM